MKKLILAGVAAMGFAAVPAVALQQHEEAGRQPMTRAGAQAMVQAHFAKVDVNHDGFIAKEEAQARMGEMHMKRQEKRTERREHLFEELDTNNDGSISKAEFDAMHGRRAGPGGMMAGGRMGAGISGKMGAMMFERADTDKDGRISLAEATAMHLAMFDRADADRDGTVTPEEHRAAMPAMRMQRQKRPNS